MDPTDSLLIRLGANMSNCPLGGISGSAPKSRHSQAADNELLKVMKGYFESV